MAKNYDDKKKKASEKIAKFVKRIIRIKERNKMMDRNKLLNGIIKRKIDNIDSFKKIMFKRLYRNALKAKNHENASKIQKFIKIKLRKYMNKKKLIKEGLEDLEHFIKRKGFNKIRNTSDIKLGMEKLKTLVEKKDNNKNELLKNKLKGWIENARLNKKITSIIKIQQLFRKGLAKDKLNNFKKKNSLLKSIHNNSENKNKIRLSIILREWLHRALIERNNNSAKIIQDKFRKMRKNQREKDSKYKLKKLLVNDFKHKIAKILEKVSKITGNKGDVIYKTLHDLLYKKPYDKLIRNMQNLGKINALKKIYPKMHEKVRNNILPKYLKKWKEILMTKLLNIRSFYKNF